MKAIGVSGLKQTRPPASGATVPASGAGVRLSAETDPARSPGRIPTRREPPGTGEETVTRARDAPAGTNGDGEERMEIMTVCTGNICRSPLAAVLLATRLADLDVTVVSAGVRGLDDAPMTPESVDLAVQHGADRASADAHRSRYLTADLLTSPDLILAMTRDHRREITALAPARLRTTFTLRELARLSASATDDDLVAAATGDDPSARLRAVAAHLASLRGLVVGPADPNDDDVIDPYGRSHDVYARSAQQLVPALAQVERLVRLAA